MIEINHRDEIVLNGVPTGCCIVQQYSTRLVLRVVKLATNRDLKLHKGVYSIYDPDFERDFVATWTSTDPFVNGGNAQLPKDFNG